MPEKYFLFPLPDFTSHLTDLQKAAALTISHKHYTYFMLEIEVEFMFYKIHMYTKPVALISGWQPPPQPP
jgi:uncharacterized membrane protein YbaN (DUF454 family)